MKSIFGFIFAIGSLLWGGTISGKITDPSGKPVYNSWVSIQNSEKYFSQYTDYLGKYSLSGIPAGKYALRINSNNYNSKCYAESLNVSADTLIQNINLQFDKPGCISGKIAASGGVALPLNLDVKVSVKVEGGMWRDYRHAYIYTTYNTFDTTYSINILEQGEYKIAIYPLQPTSYFNQFYPGQTTFEDAEIIILAHSSR